MVLVSFAFFDEFASGVPAAAAFAVREGFESDVTALALAVLVAPQVLSLGVEPLLVLWAGRRHRPTVLAVALAGMALALCCAALAPDLASFGLAFALYAPASGVAVGLAEASLMAQRSSERERALTQWMLAGTLGDLAAPLLLWSLAVCGLGWRAALGGVGLALCCASLAVFRTRIDTPPAVACPGPSLAANTSPWRPLRAMASALSAASRSLRAARSHTGLLLWLGAAASCTFMDEVLAVLVGLRVYRVTSEEALVAQSLLAFTLGGACGLVLLERRLRRAPGAAPLMIACIGSALCFGGWVALGSLAPELFGFGPALLFVAGGFTAAHYPLVLARAYAALPHDTTLVAAAAQAFGAIDLAAPLLLGVVADRFGLEAALGALLVQPLGILGALWWSARSALHARPSRRTLPP
ncbi:MAG TPA: MFS transporter [Polyangiaceae bacterium]